MSYRNFSFEQLKSIVEKYTDVIVKETESGRLLFTQHGAKLLGMYPEGKEYNALWVNRDLENVLGERQAMVGGERLWISPERDFYYENPRDFEGYHFPWEIDPGEYKHIKSKTAITYKNTFSLLEYNHNKVFDNSEEKRSFKIINDPYKTGLPYTGVSITDSISINDTEIEMCAWSITQVITCGPEFPGTALFPVKPKCKYISYFDHITPDRIDIFEHFARFKIDGRYSCKLGIRPEDIHFDNPCKAVYLTPTLSNQSVWSCVIKRSNDIPQTQNDCVDMAKSDPEGPKGAVQAFNTDHGTIEPVALPCGELGLQLNKGIVKDGKTVSKAKHELLAYTGSKNKLLELAKTALQIDEIPKLF